MDDFFPRSRESGSDGPHPMEHLDPLLDRRLETQPWQVRSAQWRAWTLAEAAFGRGVEVRLEGRMGYQNFRGLFSVVVPFRSLSDHRGREAMFMTWVSRDPILTRIPLLFVFEPDPVRSSGDPCLNAPSHR